MTDPITLLEGALKVYGPSTREQAICDYLVEQMTTLGLRAFRDPAGNAVGILESPASSPLRELVLLGHMDTVPGFIEVRRNGGSLYGRGAVDARGPLCAFIAAAALCGAQEGWRIVVVGAVEEEHATSKGARFAATQYHPDYCIIGEPSGWDRVTLGYKGRLLVHYRLSRPMGHTAGQIPSVAESAMAFWNRLHAFATAHNQGKTRAFDLLTPSLRRIHTGDDAFADSVAMTVGLRVPLGIEIETLKRDLRPMAGDADLTFASEEPAYRAEKNTPLVRAFLAGIREHGAQPGFTLKTGTSDMNVVGPLWQCPIVAYGPGDSNLDHTPDEHIDLDEYLKAIDVLTAVLHALTGTPCRVASDV
ncbi:MAG: [LysW]-lysine hydrolase [Chloroflexi bacterium]|nr:[LysW]-lysine hydrolase [Chloroflexota bacterium]MBI3732871.1 [LysW]-lysine hydrolase [Chloroflexota bacterium]